MPLVGLHRLSVFRGVVWPESGHRPGCRNVEVPFVIDAVPRVLSRHADLVKDPGRACVGRVCDSHDCRRTPAALGGKPQCSQEARTQAVEARSSGGGRLDLFLIRKAHAPLTCSGWHMNCLYRPSASIIVRWRLPRSSLRIARSTAWSSAHSVRVRHTSSSGHNWTACRAASRISCASMPTRVSPVPRWQMNSSGPLGGSGQAHHCMSR